VSQGINGAAYALLALDAKPYLTANAAIRDQYVAYLLNAQLNNGGWALDGTNPDADTTAYVRIAGVGAVQNARAAPSLII
jgi:hypothetical protein